MTATEVRVIGVTGVIVLIEEIEVDIMIGQMKQKIMNQNISVKNMTEVGRDETIEMVGHQKYIEESLVVTEQFLQV